LRERWHYILGVGLLIGFGHSGHSILGYSRQHSTLANNCFYRTLLPDGPCHGNSVWTGISFKIGVSNKPLLGALLLTVFQLMIIYVPFF
jgi:hypothetical protein